MAKPPRRPIAAAAIIERDDDTTLIVLAQGLEGRPRQWQFPRGLAEPGESAEEAMRRIAREQLAVEVEIVIGQPPLVQVVEGRELEMRYFFCGVAAGEPGATYYAELRWTPKLQLREYEFDPPSAQVVDWLLAG
jgi:ADP-ribose pyrophosphatase YjhB (NUDIX family)